MEVVEVREKAPNAEISPAAETVIAVFSGEIGCSVEGNIDSRTPLDGGNVELAPSMREEAGKVKTGGEKGKEGRTAVDLEKGVEGWPMEEEKVCRICHLSSELVGSVEEGLELIKIGCGCKGELGMAHRRCAEAWFRVKGNRLCEICGLNARGILGKDDGSFMEAWHGCRSRQHGAANNRNSPNSGSNWTSQRFCSFLVSFLVVAFVLQWYFRETFS